MSKDWKQRRKYQYKDKRVIKNKAISASLTKFAKRESFFAMISIIIVTLVTISGAYAVFTSVQKAEEYNVLKVGTLEVTYNDTEDGMGNIINLNGGFPMTDEEGLATDAYTFKVTNTGSLIATYKVKIQDDEAMIEEDGCIDNLLDKSVIKYSIDGQTPEILETKASDYIVITGELNVAESKTHTIRVWIADTAGNEILGKHFHAKIVIESQQSAAQEITKATPAYEVLFDEARLVNGAIDTSDSEQTFITGEEPNNYIWYSGKLWRAVSKDTSDNSVKLVTQWDISAVPYNPSDNSGFSGSHMEMWLNDTSVDGFLGNLRDYENFIKIDSVWNATEKTYTNTSGTTIFDTSKPEKTTMVTDAVGLLNIYEYTMSYNGTDYSSGYLNNGLEGVTLTPTQSSYVSYIYPDGTLRPNSAVYAIGVRPSINLKSSVEIVSGAGTESNPYRLKGDNDIPDNGTLLNTRYSGEYVKFGDGENNLYRIVSKENVGAKLTSAEPLKSGGSFIKKKFNTSQNMFTYTPTDSTYELAYFLNNDYLEPSNGYLTNEQVNMIENSTWYLGAVGNGENYKLAKYTDTSESTLVSSTTTGKVGLLRVGEQLSGQFQRAVVKGGSDSTELTSHYWTLTSRNSTNLWFIVSRGYAGPDSSSTYSYGARPAINLKSTIIITGGDGTKDNPFTISE